MAEEASLSIDHMITLYFSLFATVASHRLSLLFPPPHHHQPPPPQVDGVNIQGYTNQQAVEVLRHTGQTVHLKLIRRGFRPEEMPPAVTPSVAVLPPYATIPTTTVVLRELEQDRKKADDPAKGGRG